jgi:hypothetical protein
MESGKIFGKYVHPQNHLPVDDSTLLVIDFKLKQQHNQFIFWVIF